MSNQTRTTAPTDTTLPDVPVPDPYIHISDDEVLYLVTNRRAVLEDTTTSFDAKGVGYMIERNGGSPTFAEIQKNTNDSRDVLEFALNELLNAGHVSIAAEEEFDNDTVIYPLVTPLTDKGNLSMKAVSLWNFMYMRTTPPTLNDMIEQFTDGKAAVKSALKELRNAGYVILNTKRKNDGTFISWYCWNIPSRYHGDPMNSTGTRKSVSGDVNPLTPGPENRSPSVTGLKTGLTSTDSSPNTDRGGSVRGGIKQFDPAIDDETQKWEMALRDEDLMRKDLTMPQYKNWFVTIDRIVRLDNHTIEDVRRVRHWLFDDDSPGRWWIDNGNFGSVLKLRRPSKGGEAFFEMFFNKMTHASHSDRRSTGSRRAPNGPSVAEAHRDMHEAAAILAARSRVRPDYDEGPDASPHAV